MNARKVGLLLLILGLGAVVETAWSVRHHVDLGPAGCRVLGGKFYGPSFAFEEETVETVAPGTRVEVDNAFGAVRMRTGDRGRVRIGLRKVVFLPAEARAREFASLIVLRAASGGSTLRVSTNRDELARRDDEVGFETHFTIEVPPDTEVAVRNDHGSVDLADVAAAEVDNSFEPLRVENVKGTADLKARHGEVKVLGVGGALTLKARHGDVLVEDAAGHASLDVQHGDLRCTRVGSLTVEMAHGDLEAETVRGDLEVRAKHGAVAATDVTGSARVETSYDGVRLSGVGGEARIRTDHGEVRASRVKGALSAQASYNQVLLEEIGGPVDVAVVHGGLAASGLAQGARIKVTGDDVTLDGFRGPVEIESRRGAVHLVPAGALTEPLTVSTVHGGIRLEVTPGSRFVLEAASRRGEVEVEVPGLTITSTEPGRVRGELAGGGSAVKLQAEGGDVSVAVRSKSASGEI